MFDLENFGQVHRVQHLQRSHSMTNIIVYKSYNLAFFASSHRFLLTSISNCVTLKIGQGHDVQHSQLLHLMANK